MCTHTVQFLISGGISNRWQIARTIWPYMICISFAYFITLCLSICSKRLESLVHQCISSMHFYILGGISNRWQVARTIWPYMICISFAYFITLCLFPGIESEVPSCRLLSWMPVILIGIFNLFDFIGKVISKTLIFTTPQIPPITFKAFCKYLLRKGFLTNL